MTKRITTLIIPILSATLVGLAFMTIFLLAFSAPSLHQVPIASTTTLPGQLVEKTQSAVNWVETGSLEEAEAKLSQREVFAIVSLEANQVTLEISGANGPALNGALQEVAAPIAQATKMPLNVIDKIPAADNDSRGMAAFYACFGTIMTGFVFAGNSKQLAPTHRRRTRIFSAVAVGLATGIGAAVIVGPLMQAMPANVFVLASYFSLLAVASALTSLAALEIFGPPGALFSSIVMLAAGNASSSAILPIPLMDGFFTWLSHVLPTGPVVRAVLGAAYFDNADALSGILVPIAWGVVSLLAIAIAPKLTSLKTASSKTQSLKTKGHSEGRHVL